MSLILEQTVLNQPRRCGLILKPSGDSWTFSPSKLGWLYIPLLHCSLRDGKFTVIFQEVDEGQWYPITGATAISGPALLLFAQNSRYSYLSYGLGAEEILFNRDDLFTHNVGMTFHDINEGLTYSDEMLKMIAAFYRINVTFTKYDYETGEPLPCRQFSSQPNDVYMLGNSQASGIKTGQFIL